MMIYNDIHLIFLNEAFERVALFVVGKKGVNFSSIEWKSVFHKQDEIAIQCGIENALEVSEILNDAVYIIRGDTGQAAYIQKKEFDGTNLNIEGIGVEGLLAKRFTQEKDYLPPDGTIGQNKVGKVMCDIINDNRPFAWLVANAAQNQTGVSIATFTENTGNVYKYIQMLAEAYDVGFRCVYSEAANKIEFQTYEVEPLSNHIEGRTEQLSDEIGNIKSAQYERDTSKYYNYALVIGEDATAVVDQSSGNEVFEYAFKSRSKRGTKTLEQYQAILYAEGEQELAKRRIDESFVVEPKDDAYIQLGWEAVSISHAINKLTASFCTEITETWENIYKREVTMGYKADAKDITIINLQGEI